MSSTSFHFKVHRRIPLYECLVLDYGSSDSFVVAKPSGKSFVAMAVSAEEKQARCRPWTQ